MLFLSDADTVVISQLLVIGKERKEGQAYYRHAIWAAAPGSCNFALSREPPAHSSQITGGRDGTKGKMGTYTVSRSADRKMLAASQTWEQR